MNKPASTNAWLLEGPHAILRTARLHASSLLLHADGGFETLEPFAGALWQVATPLDRSQSRPLIEAYVRENDLIANYGPVARFPFATQIYWRLMRDDPDAVAVATIVSVQTDLLDTHPAMEVSCELPVAEVLLIPVDDSIGQPFPAEPATMLPREAGPHLVLLRLSGAEVSLAEAIDPSDFCGVEFSRSAAGRVRCTWRLFSHFLEKGVIRRGRLCSMLVPRKNDVEQAIRGFREFLASELPLTA